jgi:hypothetical protein
MRLLLALFVVLMINAVPIAFGNLAQWLNAILFR